MVYARDISAELSTYTTGTGALGYLDGDVPRYSIYIYIAIERACHCSLIVRARG